MHVTAINHVLYSTPFCTTIPTTKAFSFFLVQYNKMVKATTTGMSQCDRRKITGCYSNKHSNCSSFIGFSIMLLFLILNNFHSTIVFPQQQQKLKQHLSMLFVFGTMTNTPITTVSKNRQQQQQQRHHQSKKGQQPQGRNYHVSSSSSATSMFGFQTTLTTRLTERMKNKKPPVISFMLDRVIPQHPSSEAKDQRSSLPLLHSATTTTPPPTTTTTAANIQRQRSSSSSSSSTNSDSIRLKKAKLLLEQFQETEMMMIDDSNGGLTNKNHTNGNNITNTFATAAKRTTTASRITRIVNDATAATATSATPRNVNENNNDIMINTILPDTFWRNGHLIDESGSYDDDDNTAAGFGTTPSSSSSSSRPKSSSTTTTSFVTRWSRGANVAEPLIKYDPIKAERLLFRQPTKWLVRNFQIAIPLGWWAINVVTDYIVDKTPIISMMYNANYNNNNNNQKNPTTTDAKSTRNRIRAKQLTKALSSLGPAIIKGGQALASRPDLLPIEYLQELQSLQDDVPRFSNTIAIQTVEKELNISSFTDLFELIEPEPIAAASIGQVYKAKLVENNDIVALKIQRPNCEEIVSLDLYILRWWCGIYNYVIYNILQRDINLQSIIDDFGVLIYRELDYIAEASNAQRFNELYAGIAPDVFVPKIYSDYTTSRVLTMEWVDGYRITDTATMKQYNLNERKLVRTLVQCSVRQILENGFFHADPHAGNLLACPDGRLCYLDFGMMSYANQKQRNGFLLAVVHIVNRDWYELANLYIKLGFIPVGTDVEPIVVALDNALPDVLNSDISELNFKNVINSLGSVFYTFPFTLPPFYISIIRCLGVLEGLAIQVDPSIKVIQQCYPYVASRVLTDKQPDLQEAFRRLVFTNNNKQIRWERLESLLDEANTVSDYNVAAALDLFTDYILFGDSIITTTTNSNSNNKGSTNNNINNNNDINNYNNNELLQDVTNQLVQYIDSLSIEANLYVVETIRAFTINDEVAAVRAIRSIVDMIQLVGSSTGSTSTGSSTSNNPIQQRISMELRNNLPELTPSMKRFARIVALMTQVGSNNNNIDGNSVEQSSFSFSSSSSSVPQDFTKFVPVVRKLISNPQVQLAFNEVLARLGERILSRGLRTVFGLPSSSSSLMSTTSSVSTTTATTTNKSRSSRNSSSNNSRILSSSLSTVTEDRGRIM